MKLKIKNIKHSARRADVYDVETPTHDYILEGGIISHNTLELYSKDVVGGGSGGYYSADTIFIIGRQQEKDGKELTGYNFIINVEKSRYVREKSKIPIEVSFDSGISIWSGLLDAALESGHITTPKRSRYTRTDPETGEVEEKNYTADETYNKAFWLPILQQKSFQDWIQKKYMISSSQSIITDEELGEVYNVND